MITISLPLSKYAGVDLEFKLHSYAAKLLHLSTAVNTTSNTINYSLTVPVCIKRSHRKRKHGHTCSCLRLLKISYPVTFNKKLGPKKSFLVPDLKFHSASTY